LPTNQPVQSPSLGSPPAGGGSPGAGAAGDDTSADDESNTDNVPIPPEPGADGESSEGG